MASRLCVPHEQTQRLRTYFSGAGRTHNWSYRQVYEHEAAWAEVMFNEWGADGVKVDHMCQGANCGTGAQGHMMAVEFQQVRHPHLTLT